MLAAALLAAPLACAAQQPAPQLEQRSQPPEQTVALDSQITAPVIIPQEAWGHYTFGRELDLLEIDLEPQGLSGYITLLGDKALKGPDKGAPLTFFFAKSRVGGDSVYFLTQQIHRVSYEFSGTLQSALPHDKTLLVDYALSGALTVHHLDKQGHDVAQSRPVVFKKVPDHPR
jgi:hypothetical protein